MFTKDNVSITEYKIHKYVYNQKIVKLPKPISYDKEQKIFVMQKNTKYVYRRFLR